MTNDFGNTDIQSEPGTKDAFHVPCVVAKATESLYPGCRVRFADNTLQHVYRTTDEPHGIINPFLIDDVVKGEKVYVLLMPGMVDHVQHVFDVDIRLSQSEISLHQKLEEIRKNDPNCAGCWQIEDGKIIRY
jgi:hypothetical protein